MKTIEVNLKAQEIDWEIGPGKVIRGWGYNGQIPGPVIKGKIGDKVIVRLYNQLSDPTTIHWHGIRLNSKMDGTEEVQRSVQPGEIYEYQFDLTDAGTFWYHSHSNETQQMERGLYGALIVENEDDPVFDDEKIFLIDDMKLNAENKFTEPGWFFPRLAERHDGREGNVNLINGKENPEIEVNAGQVERWRFINGASARYFRLSLDGKPFKIIATDGGLIEKPVEATEVLITPGERVDIIAGPFNEGENLEIQSLSYNRMTMVKSRKQKYATIKVGKPKTSIATIPDILREIKPLADQNAQINRKVNLSVGMNFKNGVDFLVNGKNHAHDHPVRVGELQVWEVSNSSLMDHPFHLHGFFFQVLEENGKAPEFISWKDTYNLKPKSKIKIAWMPDNRPGMWMYHCHILEHHAAGMMGHFEVVA